MATRRDYMVTAEILRTTAMPAPLRYDLARKMAAAFASTSTGFEAGKFIFEATRAPDYYTADDGDDVRA